MADSIASEGSRRGSSVVPTPPPLFIPRTDSDRLRISELAQESDDTPTIVSTARPNASAESIGNLRGRLLGHFELIEAVGVGGMAAVIRARDSVLGREVALKILPPGDINQAEHIARFQSEARAAAKLDHENIARVYFCGEDQGLHFIAFEFVEGENLRSIIDRQGPLSSADAISYLRQIATGLAHASERGVIHRDVKPSNIIITAEGRAKIVDMGLARHLDGPADRVTQSGVTLGTFDYISPEQALEPRLADVRSDIYSLGCTFYHALTGHVPVPEGTAAKKLHAHQHVPPPDPRLYNPAIPDSLAMILGRMMAKNAADRYQTPSSLLAELAAMDSNPGSAKPTASLLARSSSKDTSDRTAAIWVVVSSVLLLLAITGIIEATRLETSPILLTAGNRLIDDTGRRGEEADRTEDPPSVAAPVVPMPMRPAEVAVSAANVDELRRALAKGDSVLHVRLTGSEPYVLDRRDGSERAGLSFTGKKLEIESADPAAPATIRFAAAGDEDRVALTIGHEGEAGAVSIRGIRFEVTSENPETPVAAIVAEGPERLDIEKSVFLLPESTGPLRGAGAVVIEGRRDGEASAAFISESLFIRGSQAIQLEGKARVRVSQSAFGPHNAAVYLRETGNPDDTSVRLEHCSILLENGSAFALDDRAGGTLAAGYCLISRPVGEVVDDSPGDAVLIRQTGSKAGEVLFKSVNAPDGPQRNVYHNLAAFWSDETPAVGYRRSVTLEDANRRPDFREDDALELPISPWQSPHPLTLLNENPRGAFAVDLRLARLRLPRQQSTVLGVMRNVWGASYRSPIEPPASEATVSRMKVVDPTRATDASTSTYRTLEAAILEAKPNDTILIRANGRLDVEPQRLEKSDLRLTIRPFANYRPILALSPTLDAEVSIFRIHDGRIEFEGLQFHLHPQRPDVKQQSVVVMTGSGQVQFKDCVITLEETEDDQLAAILISESNDRSGRGSPNVRFESAIVRGKGDLLNVRGGKRFEIELDNCLACLDGSMVRQDGSNREPTMGAPSSLRMRRVTSAVTEPLVLLKANRDEDRSGPGLYPVAVTCDGSLIAAVGGRPIVRVEGIDSEEIARQLLLWSASPDAKPTFYANTGPVLFDVVPLSVERMAPMPLDQERWLTFTHERSSASPFVKLKFATNPVADKLAHRLPTDFRIRSSDPMRPETDITSAGAVLDRLPRPGDAD